MDKRKSKRKSQVIEALCNLLNLNNDCNDAICKQTLLNIAIQIPVEEYSFVDVIEEVTEDDIDVARSLRPSDFDQYKNLFKVHVNKDEEQEEETGYTNPLHISVTLDSLCERLLHNVARFKSEVCNDTSFTGEQLVQCIISFYYFSLTSNEAVMIAQYLLDRCYIKCIDLGNKIFTKLLKYNFTENISIKSILNNVQWPISGEITREAVYNEAFELVKSATLFMQSPWFDYNSFSKSTAFSQFTHVHTTITIL